MNGLVRLRRRGVKRAQCVCRSFRRGFAGDRDIGSDLQSLLQACPCRDSPAAYVRPTPAPGAGLTSCPGPRPPLRALSALRWEPPRSRGAGHRRVRYRVVMSNRQLGPPMRIVGIRISHNFLVIDPLTIRNRMTIPTNAKHQGIQD